MVNTFYVDIYREVQGLSRLPLDSQQAVAITAFQFGSQRTLAFVDDDTIIVTHDSVRPFLTYRIIEDNIRYAQEYGACDTVIPASDTIVESVGHEVISNIPDRSVMYQGQTPQSFKAKKLKELYEGLTEDEKEILTDACKIFVIKGQDVHLVEGEVFNIKITYPYDLRVAETLIKGEDK